MDRVFVLIAAKDTDMNITKQPAIYTLELSEEELACIKLALGNSSGQSLADAIQRGSDAWGLHSKNISELSRLSYDLYQSLVAALK